MKKKNIKKLLIYGGGFDPVHNGHINLLKSAINRINPNLVFIAPSKKPLLSNKSSHYASFADRLNMCKIAFSKLGKKIYFSDFENKYDRIYTFQLIKFLRCKYRNYSLFFLLGSDRAINFKRWKNFEYISNNSTIVIGKRNNVNCKLNFDFIRLKLKVVNILSSSLREKIDKKYMPLDVINYIIRNGLYIESKVEKILMQSSKNKNEAKERYEHILRVKETALDIAKAIGYKKLRKVYIASIFHDLAKNFSDKKIQLYSKAIDKSLFPNLHSLHGVCASNYVQKHFSFHDKEVLDAVENHVIPKINCSILSKILYCADKLEPNRTKEDIPNREKMLKEVKKNINVGFAKLYMQTMAKYEKGR